MKYDSFDYETLVKHKYKCKTNKTFLYAKYFAI